MLNELTEHLDLLTTTRTNRSTSVRGRGNKLELAGIKKLRELILELAVRGRLVPQNPEDEPASALLEKIAAEKAQLVKEGKIKKQNPLPAMKQEEKFFELPDGWEWCRLTELIPQFQNGASSRGDKDGENVIVLRLADIKNWQVSLEDTRSLTITHNSITRYSVEKDDVLIIRVNGSAEIVGRFITCSKDYDVIYCDHFIRMRFPIKCLDSRYLSTLGSSRLIRNKIADLFVSTAGQKTVNQTHIGSLPIAYPPLAEQHRIVTKVDELMALCDQLEQEETISITAHQTLVDVMLTTLTDSKDAFELAESWSLVAEHFDTLFTTEASITRLRQTILQLAVMGRLVPQNPDDEPAAKLLERISAEKVQLIKDGKIKKQKKLPTITDKEKLVELPNGWKWVRLGEVITLISGQHLKPDEYTGSHQDGTIPYITGPAEFGPVYPTFSKYTKEKRAVSEHGDILITCKGSGIGKMNLAKETTAISRQLMSIRPILLKSDYVQLITKSLYRYFQSKGVGIAIPGISREDINDVIIACPPEPEQKRIVTRINELMTLCKTLQQQVQQAQSTQQQLASALVEQAITTHNQPNESHKVA
ncbi:restriction endonuclease subunit S [Endozoicomonas sp.]|uniref:restriction endonuclease subunit S n=1 Tax=Endozoicomonas sp. TaxID=1892382 RepID=UPI0028836FB2|nr:restriction endonuclease subunit S [Endozoicomonas sp.]